MSKIVVLFIIVYLTSILESVHSTLKPNVEKTAKLPPCRACKIFIESLKRGMTRTEKGKFEGGDTAWEEEKLGKYATSEIRLTEIQEKLCSDTDEGKDQCYAISEEFDQEIEDWWLNKQKDNQEIFEYFCINTFKYCCPDLHYGPDCIPCKGFPNEICSGNGKCKGAGTRKGNGKCDCSVGYTGENCNICTEGYYEAYKDNKKLLCSKCHVSCMGACTKAGPLGCVKCNSGWVMDEEKGCKDVNECTSQSSCTKQKFCVNNEGSFRCLDCDKSCEGCTGDGPDMCINCAKGYVLKENMCIDQEQESRQKYVFLTRYLTYLGLCIATCIIFNKNTFLAALIGIAVAIYISVSEYVLNLPPTPKTDNIVKNIMEN